jgi:hypothetical protein
MWSSEWRICLCTTAGLPRLPARNWLHRGAWNETRQLNAQLLQQRVKLLFT